MPEREQEALEPDGVHALADRSQPLAGARATLHGPERIIALQRAAGNAAVVRMLARTLSPPPAPGAQLPQMLGQLDPAVQTVLHRRGHARVGRPHGGWVVREASDERIDFDWVALLFVLHRTDAASGALDYLTVLERLIIPAIEMAPRRPRARARPARRQPRGGARLDPPSCRRVPSCRARRAASGHRVRRLARQ
jgi:hypothetical protein